MKKKKVFVMMSGGVDSSVAAALLKKRSFDVIGIFMKNWDGEAECQWIRDEQDARRAAAKLCVPFYVLNFEKEYQKQIFEPFLKGLQEGKTPNPDIFCNKLIKFGVFLERALTLGADLVATGHYARLRGEIRNSKLEIRNRFPLKAKPSVLHRQSFPNSKFKIRYKLLKAKDESKDQTYFLYRLNQFQLSKTLFPIGDYTKDEVRKIAKAFGLPTYNKQDSQGLCFVGEVPFETFLERYLPLRQGPVLDKEGNPVGWHKGVAFYTIGQRRGLGIGGLKTPLFVAQKDIRANTLTAVVENDPLLYESKIIISEVHWISGKIPVFPLRCRARIRHGQEPQPCVISSLAKDITVVFYEPQRALTPGQSIVLYHGQEVLGGGIIWNG